MTVPPVALPADGRAADPADARPRTPATADALLRRQRARESSGLAATGSGRNA
ncbi:hypothetical protein ABZ707_12770 [Streptomyces sp. NPDC006923]|uniref:hypothetical protein n=1 Tax=Streptomyces sp. NPDC006923 TaxID=3155355 RepID=UPI00340855ED